MAQPGSHALVFRVMRLARPSLTPEDTLAFSMQQDFVPDAAAAAQQPHLASALPAGYPFAGRVQLDPAGGGEGQGGGLSGLLALPQSFGLVYLGETFSAYVTVCNNSDQPVTNVAVKVELQTDASKIVLYDCTPSPIRTLGPGQRHDFLIKHDIKELGPHTLACSALYTPPPPDSERKFLPQHFRFASANPMVVRTRHRLVGSGVFLEATLENSTKGPIVMELVRFTPHPPYTAAQVGGTLGPKAQQGTAAAAGAAATAAAAGALPAVGGGGVAEATESAGPLGDYLRSVPVMPEGGALSYLFHLTQQQQQPSQGASPAAAAAAGRDLAVVGAAGAAAALPLGRLEIRWRGHMGQAARLQTQTITMPSPPPRDLSLSLSRLPRCLVAECPFPVELKVQNSTDRRLGPLRITLDGSSAAGGTAAGGGGGRSGGGGPGGGSAEQGGAVLLMDGLQSVILEEVPPRQTVQVAVQLVALAPGQHALAGLALSGERDGRLYDTLPRQELFVLPACAS